MSRALTALAAIAVASALAACGGDESELIGENALRECLADQGLGARPQGEAPATPPVYLSTAPDFSAYTAAGVRLDVVVHGNEEKAERTAAHVRGAMLPLGIRDAQDRVIVKHNVVAVFAETPSAQEREAASSCVE